MSETYEVNLLRNVHAVDSKSSVSKEFPVSKESRQEITGKEEADTRAGMSIARVLRARRLRERNGRRMSRKAR